MHYCTMKNKELELELEPIPVTADDFIHVLRNYV